MSDSDARAYLQQASDFMVNDRFQEAITCYESALDTLERTYGENDPHLADCLQELAEAYECGSRLRDAVRIYNRSLALNEATVGVNTPIVAETLYKLTQINEKLDRPAEALAFARRAQEIAGNCLAEGDSLKRLINNRYRHLAGLAGGFGVDLETDAADTAASSAPSWGAEGEAQEPDAQKEEQKVDDQALARLLKRKHKATTESTGRSKRYGSESIDAPALDAGKLIRIISLTGLLALVVIVPFFFMHKTVEPPKPLPAAETKTTKKPSAIGERYRSPDNQKEVCFWSNNEATIRTAGSARR
ncbi:MAG: tetratricopeptide repeat protein, partial [Cyanobacteria bacterium SZAS LIN-2]|nr:tetratricopeptide repeat protein [Cyanobacteria bacterium SZAS LIN-2]